MKKLIILMAFGLVGTVHGAEKKGDMPKSNPIEQEQAEINELRKKIAAELADMKESIAQQLNGLPRQSRKYSYEDMAASGLRKILARIKEVENEHGTSSLHS